MAMTQTDAVIALLLAFHLHGTDEAIRTTAKRCAVRLPRSKRDLMFSIAGSARPLAFLGFINQNLEIQKYPESS
jgi:hypothetical protein